MIARAAQEGSASTASGSGTSTDTKREDMAWLREMGGTAGDFGGRDGFALPAGKMSMPRAEVGGRGGA